MKLDIYGSTDSVLQNEMKLDIYGNTQQDIRNCKDELTWKLKRSLQTLIWSERPNYEQDRKSIIKLSQLQVCCNNYYSHIRVVYRQNCIFVCL